MHAAIDQSTTGAADDLCLAMDTRPKVVLLTVTDGLRCMLLPFPAVAGAARLHSSASLLRLSASASTASEPDCLLRRNEGMKRARKSMVCLLYPSDAADE